MRGSLPGTVRAAFIIAGKDLRSELRRRTALVSAVVFAALILAIFNFARDPTALRADQLAPSAFWITCAFAAVTALSRAFAVELEHGALDGLLLAPVPRESGRSIRGRCCCGAAPSTRRFSWVRSSRMSPPRATSPHRC